ncbi:hypothetical protein RI570_19435 [Brucella pseudogrignonensis]|uniref:hypothetical protein n=1 Tax=Brucella pseudogrignonensis TaxID=419475 RepID=UPI0028BC8CF2|nr:hypothetical protein [Brucella pseudogrignonensis]MDT6942252.1 hypothetical protein [Brucella pseudogrignonensis]
MKNPIRNVVVEYKNKRTRKGNSSLWGGLDLKSISREVEATILQSSDEVATQTGAPDLRLNLTKYTVAEKLRGTAVAKNIDEYQAQKKASVVETLELQKGVPDTGPFPPSELTPHITPKKNDRPVQDRARVVQKKQQRAVIYSAGDEDVVSELSFLERENASLKRELIAKLRLENENMAAMIARAEQRLAQKR